ncbi:MAG: hypothetical protein WCA46_15360, partial [Actinocatenispora sp.]
HDQGQPPAQDQRGWGHDQGQQPNQAGWDQEQGQPPAQDQRGWEGANGPAQGSWAAPSSGGPTGDPRGAFADPAFRQHPDQQHPDQQQPGHQQAPAERSWDQPGPGSPGAPGADPWTQGGTPGADPWTQGAPGATPDRGYQQPDGAPGHPGQPADRPQQPGYQQQPAPGQPYDQPGFGQQPYDQPGQSQPPYGQPQQPYGQPGQGREPDPAHGAPGRPQEPHFPTGPQRGGDPYPGQGGQPPQNSDVEPGSWWEGGAARGSGAPVQAGRREDGGGSGSGGGGPGPEPLWPQERAVVTDAAHTSTQHATPGVSDTLPPAQRFAEQLDAERRAAADGRDTPLVEPHNGGSGQQQGLYGSATPEQYPGEHAPAYPSGPARTEHSLPTDPPPRPWTASDRDGPAGDARPAATTGRPQDAGMTAQIDQVPRRQEPRYADLNPMETTNSLTGRILGPRNAPVETTSEERGDSRTTLTVLILVGAVVVLALVGVALWLVLS